MRLLLLGLLFVSFSCKKKNNHQPESEPNKTTCALSSLPNNLQNGVVTYYSFCGNTNDVSANNNNGSLTNGSFTIDRFGNSNNALLLNGNNSLVCSINPYNNPQAFTISVWIKTTNSSYSRIIVFDESQCSHINNWDRSLFMQNGQAGFYVFPGSEKTVIGGPNIADNKWHQIAATLSSVGMKLYVDGSLAASNSAITSAQNFNGYWRVGGFQNTTLIGAYDDVLIYNRALGDSEIQQLYQQ